MSGLSPRQQKTLRFMQKFRDDPPTLAGMVAANWKRYFFLLGYFAFLGTGVAVGVYFGWPELIPFGCVLAGLLFGILLRDISAMNAAVNVWPVQREVIDWEKVRQLLEEDH